MKVSYLWLRELTGIEWSPDEMAKRMVACGLNCESVESTAVHMKNVVVGHVKTVDPVEGASKIRKTTVDVGTEVLQVICGAPNVAVGQKVPVALVGATVAGGLEIKKAKIRGVESSGMICAEDELGISGDHGGIMVLDSSAVIGRPLVDELDFDDYILDVELTPNRGDAWSAIGMARDLAAVAGVKVRRPSVELKTSREKASSRIRVSIDDPAACPRFTARVITGVKIGPSPWWLRRRLLACGVRPISNVVDITNFVMLECGNPLHAFDFDRFGSDHLVVRRAKDKEKLTTLDGKEHTLSPVVLLITNAKEALGAAGVMGGASSEVSDSTTTVLLEVAYFDPKVIRRGRKMMDKQTDASNRFERGVDPNGLDYASSRAAALMCDLAGGTVLDGLVDNYPTRIEPRTVILRPERCDAILGVKKPVARMREILTGLEFTVEGNGPLKVTAPTFRHDIEKEIDLIEEIARIDGYDTIPGSVHNTGPLFTPEHREDLFEHTVRRLMTGAGFDEILGHGLAHSRQATLLYPDLPQLRVLNPVAEDLDIMRNTLLLTSLEAVGHNISHRNVDLRLFEIGRAYFPPVDDEFREDSRLSLAVTGNTPGNWRDKPRPQDFYDLTGALEILASHYHWPNLEFVSSDHSIWDKGTAYRITAGGKEIGVIGRLQSELGRKFDIKQPVYLAELQLDTLMTMCREGTTFQPLPVFPAAPRDLALIVDQSVRVQEIISTVQAEAGNLAEAVRVFDLYIGKPIPAGKKSVGIAITYRAADRSLSGEEVDAVQQKVVGKLKERYSAELREA